MAQHAVTHIKAVNIQNLWRQYDIYWELDPKVNILIGINGRGKTTILNLTILVMDEPESSLHLEWQERLIEIMLKLNEHIQLIIATHSPGIMMKVWLDKVTEIENITTRRN